MMNAHASLTRRAGPLLIAGAVTTLAGCTVVGIATSNTSVADNLFRYPLTHDSFGAFTVYAAITHLLILAGVIGLRGRGEVALAGRAASVSLGCVAAGTALLCLCELASLPLVDRLESDTWAVVVDAGFGIASLLATFGMIVAGVALARRSTRPSWSRYAPLTCGILSLVVIPIQLSSALWLGIAIYGLGYGILGTAMVTEASGARQPTTTATAAR